MGFHHLSFALAAVAFMSFIDVSHETCFPQTVLPNLRQYQMTGVAGLFRVSRDVIEGRYLDFKESIGGDDLNMTLTDFGPSADHSRTVGLIVADMTTHWTYFDEALQVDASETQRSLYVSVIIHTYGQQRLLNIGEVTEENESVNWNTSFHVDQVFNNGDTATFKLNNDVIRIIEDIDEECIGENPVHHSTDCSSAKLKVYMKYDGYFDWGCDGKWSDSQYCKVLGNFKEGIEEAGRNVCVVAESLPGTKCPARMSVESVTGVFEGRFPFLKEAVGSSALVATYSSKYHEAGLIFPCIV